MLDRQHNNIFFECDACHEVLETETSNFPAALNLMKRDGWRAVKAGDDWEHYCPRCKEASY